MLDELDSIARFDSENVLAFVAGQGEQLLYNDFETPKLKKPINNIVFAGMGGSALAGGIVKNWLQGQLRVPFEVVRGYELPAYVGGDTLVIASSYSGNTEEDLADVAAASKNGAQVVIVASGGKLEAVGAKHNMPIVDLPEGYPPRLAVMFGVRVTAAILETNGLVSGALKELEDAATVLNSKVVDYVAQTKLEDNYAKQLATGLFDHAIWVYAGPTLREAAYKWKINFNETSKNIASCNVLPELDHNEIVGWTSHPKAKPYAVVELQSSLDNDQIQKRWEATNRLLSGQMPKPIEVQAEGKSAIEQTLLTILLGDFVSVYLAVLNNVNPTRVDIIDKLKQAL